MRIGVSIVLTMAVVTIGALLPPSVYAGGGHHGFGHGGYHGYDPHFEFGFAFSPYQYPYGYPYSAAVYIAPVQRPPPIIVYRQRT